MCGYSLIYQSTFIHTYYECQNHCVQVSDPLSLPTDLVRLALHQDRINQLAFFILITLGESLLSFSSDFYLTLEILLLSNPRT